MGDDSKRRAVVKGCDQRDQERATCRSGLKKVQGPLAATKKPCKGVRKATSCVGLLGVEKGLARTYAAACLADGLQIGLLKGSQPTV